jgi:CopG family nickel-responsive transcriptional regulator
MKEKVVRFSVSVYPELLKKFDAFVKEKGFPNRSEAFRALLKRELVEEEWQAEEKETIGVLTIVYDHHKSDIVDKLVDTQHHFHPYIITTLHIHLDEDNCVEAIFIKGKVKEIREVEKAITSIKGIKFENLALATTGKEIP